MKIKYINYINWRKVADLRDVGREHGAGPRHARAGAQPHGAQYRRVDLTRKE